MAEKQSFLAKQLGKFFQKSINQLTEERVNEEKKRWAEETAEKIVFRSNYSIGREREYTTNSGKKIKASETDSRKKWSLLYDIFAEAPGSPQCADRIRSAVTGAGYILQPVPNGNKNKEQLRKLIAFYDEPNSENTIEDIAQSICTNFYAFGNSYLEKVFEDGDSTKEVVEIYNLNSENTKILVDAERRKAGINEIVGYDLYVPFAEGNSVSDKTITYSRDEITHFKRTDPRGGLYGKPLFEDNQAVIQLILQALGYNIKTFENSGKPPLKIRLPEGTSSTEAEEFSNFFEKNFQGIHNAGKALVLYNNADAAALGLSPADIEYLKLLTFGLKQVAGMYGVPMIMISQPEGSNRATSYEETKSFYQRVIQPLRNYIDNKLTKEINVQSLNCPDWRLDFQDIDLEDSTSRVEEASKSFMYGTRSWNEARKRMALEAGTESWMDDFYVVHNGIATPLRDFSSGKAKTQTDKLKEKAPKEEKKPVDPTKKSEETEKSETSVEAKKKAKKENDQLNKGEVISAMRSDNHKVHLEQHKKVLFTIKDKYRASLRVHMYSHEDLMWEQNEDGNYGEVDKE
jgi:HK97 family phage portal protein